MMKKSQIKWAGRCFGPAVTSIKSAALLLAAAAALTAHADSGDRGQSTGRQESQHRLPEILRSRELRQRDPLDPIVRIVSPLADSSVAPGESRIGAPSPNGTAFALNLEVVTRDKIAVRAKEATLAPPVFGIRHVPELEQIGRASCRETVE